jgi:large subunit ribosomal protein L29
VATKRFKELKNMTKDELLTKVRTLQAELFQARMKTVTGQLEDTSTVWKLRKDLARVKTLQTLQSGQTAGAVSEAAQVARSKKKTQPKAEKAAR